MIVMEDHQENSSTSSSLISSFSSFSLPNPPLFPIDPDLWLLAEERTQEILCAIQPARVSEKKRKEVIEYIQQLVKGYFGIELFPFGSVPLKTYLPDGDIDLTALCPQILEEDLAVNLCKVLESEELDLAAEVKDVQYVRAQVKIVKCNVKEIPVDISFNQTAGLSALCFLEHVDNLIGKDHLFKQSIILIKAWCYYESRILGSHYGLISTYALEMLVLCIINRFHSSLTSPLAVLYKFLDYYSAFDWDNYFVSMNGPFPISSLKQFLAGALNDGDYEMLLNQEFVRKCKEIYALPMKTLDTNGNEFPIKHINILDPLKDDNNLGRSVSKGNFHRIRCALAYGAQRLKEILMLPCESMGMGLEKFFANTLERNGKGQRPDVRIAVPAFGTGRSVASDLSGDFNGYYSGLLCSQSYYGCALPVSAHHNLPSPPHLDIDLWEILRNYVRTEASYQQQTETYVPNSPTKKPHASQQPAAKMEKSRGTGTYIPNVNHYSYRILQVPNVETRVLSKKHRRKIYYKGEDLPDLETGVEKHVETAVEKNCPNLTLEEFPLLPVTKNSIPETNCHQSVIVSMNSNGYAPPPGRIRFGSFECSTSKTVRLEMQEQSPRDGNGIMGLRDAAEFPPLSSLKA